MIRAAALAALLLGCGLTTYSRDYLIAHAQEDCERIYCNGYGKPPMEKLMADCPYIADAVPICVEDYMGQTRNRLNWFGNLLLTTAEAFK